MPTKLLTALGKIRNLSFSKEERHAQVQETLFEKCWNEVKNLEIVNSNQSSTMKDICPNQEIKIKLTSKIMLNRLIFPQDQG